MTDTLFLSIRADAFQERMDDPSLSQYMDSLKLSEKYNVQYYRKQQIEIDNLQTIILPALSNYSPTQWLFFVARVIGNAALDIVTNGGMPVMSIEGFGNENLPGLIVHSGTNIASGGISLTGLADNSVVELMIAVCLEDDEVV